MSYRPPQPPKRGNCYKCGRECAVHGTWNRQRIRKHRAGPSEPDRYYCSGSGMWPADPRETK